MLFNSYPFVFLFLPLAWLIFFLAGAASRRLGAVWLVVASVVFYGWWDLRFVPLLLGSIIFNFHSGVRIAQWRAMNLVKRSSMLSTLAVIANLLLLAYFKYANFFVSALDEMTGAHWQLPAVLLPIGISFFTFTQIAYLVDARRGLVREYNFIHYALFVTYFPHLIAGPILHHKEMMPQFAKLETYRFNYRSLSVGMTMFIFGLAKKVLLADNMVSYVHPVFDGPAGSVITLVDGWGAALAYALELYFDFSGYSDMAIGLSLMFNVRLPANFNSPYKAVNIIDFWRRWHMTLSRFLRDYLYFPLGGNRKGPVRRYVNLFITMLLGGLWHGAGWTFVLWGALHGVYLSINHGWRALRQHLGADLSRETAAGRVLARSVTFLAVTVAWVFFRASNFDEAVNILRGMSGRNGFALPATWLPRLGSVGPWLAAHGAQFVASIPFGGVKQIVWSVALLGVAWFMPNTQQLLARYAPALEGTEGEGGAMGTALAWQPGWQWGLAIGVIGFLVIANMSKPQVFLYFQF
jgi:alginate O-acetyltransferase complex protein AlgI